MLDLTNLDALESEMLATGKRQKDPNVIAVALMLIQVLRELRELRQALKANKET